MQEHLKIASWNVHLGLDRETLTASLRSGVFDAVDVLFLQEVSIAEGITDSERFAEVLGGYRAYQRTVDHYHRRVRGLGVVWNPNTVSLSDFDIVPLPLPHHTRLHPFHQYSLNTLGVRARFALAFKAASSGARSILGYNIHLSPVSFAYQVAQLRAVLSHHSQHGSGDVAILAGDFNSLRIDRRKWEPWLDYMELRRGFVNVTRDVDWTFRTFKSPRLLFRQKLDNILVRAAAPFSHTASCEDVPGSDHLPLFAGLTWR